ncbi:hypothetical protein MHU86_19757 [Fragilaria crotonensis]|nr:hypothetical protein MHU86_19757 [Fragilaria crotonensis]
MAYGMGPASGRQPTSYRAEAYGMLSLMRFLLRIREYSSMHDEWSGTIGTDSKSVLDTLMNGDHDLQEEEVPVDLDGDNVVLDALRPDWDVLIEIQEAMHRLPNVRLTYVRGHQDRKKRYESLTLMGQLNVNADHEAGIFQDVHGLERPLVLMSPMTRAHLHLPDGTVTGNYDRCLQHEATAKPLLEYIQTKNQWTPSIMNSVDWTAHANALKKHSTRKTHMVKLLHELLPTTGQANRFDDGKRQCPLCPTTREDRDHILCCNHPTRREWREKFMRDLTDHCMINDTDPNLQIILCDGLQAWFNRPQGFTLQPHEYDSRFHRLITQQNRIGWRQIFHGRFSVEWVRHQDSYYSQSQERCESSHRTSFTGESWLINLIRFVWDKWYTLWKQRNQELHGRDVATRMEAESKEVRRQLNDIYMRRQQLEPCVQDLLFEEVEQHYEVSTAVTKNWLRINSGLFRDSMRRVKTKAIQGVRSIRTYFAPIR